MDKKEYFDSLPKTIRKYIMTSYLYEDIFSNKIFIDFFNNGD